ncbi:MAG: hypothetical protein HQ564_06215 [Candidatus Saganbacteria bacterium]|nr:hypothetical protein [Candidatus Saganbacteria bacterium]
MKIIKSFLYTLFPYRHGARFIKNLSQKRNPVFLNFAADINIPIFASNGGFSPGEVTPPPSQILKIKNKNVSGGANRLLISLKEELGGIDFCWNGKGEVYLLIIVDGVEHESPVLSPGDNYLLQNAQLLEAGKSFAVKIRKPHKYKIISVATREFELAYPTRHSGVYRAIRAKDVAEEEIRNISMPRTRPQKWFWRWLKPSPKQTFAAATKAMLASKTDKRYKLKHLCGKDIASAIYTIEQLREFLFSLEPEKAADLLDDLQQAARRNDIRGWASIKNEFALLVYPNVSEKK